MTPGREILQAALDGAGQSALVDQAIESGASPFEAPRIAAEALHVVDLRAAVREFGVTTPSSSRWHGLRRSIVDEAIRATACSRASGPERSARVWRYLNETCGDLTGWHRIRADLFDLPRHEHLPDPDGRRSELERILDAFGDAPAVSSEELVDLLALDGPRELADLMLRHGATPRRLRLPGRAPGTRGYRRADIRIP